MPLLFSMFLEVLARARKRMDQVTEAEVPTQKRLLLVNALQEPG